MPLLKGVLNVTVCVWGSSTLEFGRRIREFRFTFLVGGIERHIPEAGEGGSGGGGGGSVMIRESSSDGRGFRV